MTSRLCSAGDFVIFNSHFHLLLYAGSVSIYDVFLDYSPAYQFEITVLCTASDGYVSGASFKGFICSVHQGTFDLKLLIELYYYGNRKASQSFTRPVSHNDACKHENNTQQISTSVSYISISSKTSENHNNYADNREPDELVS